MVRALLIILAALTAGIAYAIEPWLYLAAGALLLGAIGLLVRDWQRERRRRERRSARAEAAAENDDELRSLGIVEIRPRDESKKEQEEQEEDVSPETASEPSEAVPAATAEEAPPPEQDEADRAESSPPTSSEPAPTPVKQETTSDEGMNGTEGPREEPAATDEETLGALVRAARLTMEAPVAALLAQEEMRLTYRVEALDAADGAPPLLAPGATFSTDDPLLSASAARRSVTHRPVGTDDGWTPPMLGYYRRPIDIDPARLPAGVMLAPLPRKGAAKETSSVPTARFLLVEVPEGSAPAARKEAIMERFADLLAQVTASPSEQHAGDEAPETTAAQHAAGNGAAPAAPRPRREIIAEEMEEARREGRNLALALVYLNRAEAVAERGTEEVRAAERALRARLRRAAPDGRVEPFGELTYGVFYSSARDETEAWAVALQEELSEAEDPLEGGVSVGLALMRGPEQDPSALRQNATNALREAYTTGTCTILE